MSLILHLTCSGIDINRILPAKSYVAIVSEAGHFKVSLDKSIQDVPIYFAGNGTSAIIQLRALADALDATVIKTPDGFLITQRKTDTAKILDRRQRMRSGWINAYIKSAEDFRKRKFALGTKSDSLLTAALDRAKAMSAPRSGIDKPALGILHPGLLTPAMPYTFSLIDRMGSGTIASLPSGTRTIYEDSPAKGAYDLPNHADLDAKYASDCSSFALGNLTAQQQSALRSSGIDPQQFAQSAVKPIFKTRITIQSSVDSLIVRSEAFDQSGTRLFFLNCTITPKGEVVTDERIQERHSLVPQTEQVLLSSETTDALRSISTMDCHQSDWLLHPDRQEPLNLFVRDAIRGMASHWNKCFAMAVSDGLWDIARAAVSGQRLNLSVMQDLIDSHLPYERLETQDSIVLRPVDSLYEAQAFTPRTTLAALARNLASNLDIRAIATALKDLPSANSWLANFWLLASQSTRDQRLWFDASIRFFRFIGSIDDSGWQTLERRGQVSLRELEMETQFIELLSQDSSLRVQSHSTIPDALRLSLEAVPKEAVGNVEIQLQINKKRQSKIFTTGSKPPGGWDEFPGYGAYLCIPGTVDVTPSGDFVYTTSREVAEARISKYSFLFGTGTDYLFTFQLGEGSWLEQSISGGTRQDGNPVRYSQLSKDEQDKAWEDGRNEAIRRVKEHPPANLNELLGAQKGKNGKIPPDP